MAKDNLPFHTIMFPAMILGTREDWKLADQIRGFNWLTYYGGKFSTSSKRGVFLDQALSLYEADYWGYSLLSIIPFTSVKLFDALQLSESDKPGTACASQRMIKISESVNFEALPIGHVVREIPPLFRKLDDKEIQELTVKFGKKD
jgi:hypothetical protein